MEPARKPPSEGSPAQRPPSVDSVLRQPAIEQLLDEFPRGELVEAVRAVLDAGRRRLLAGDRCSFDPTTLALRVREELHARAVPCLRRVVNATGIVLHTGLGRAPLAPAAIDAICDVARGYSNLEYDVATGERGDRQAHCRNLLRELTGAEDALVVNNNAAATFLALHATARDGGVVVSRGQLVEIGGSYRMPDIMRAAGCAMIEVGTTNRTHLRDYEEAIDGQARAILRVHTSNYRITGFTSTPDLSDLARLARARDLLLIDDLGSGLLEPSDAPEQPGWDEPSVRESVADGADITLFSGDKLLGGPQAGIVVGRREVIERLKRDPLMRTFRPDKLTLAGLEATLRLYRDPDALAAKLPVRRLLQADLQTLEECARQLGDVIRRWDAALDVDLRTDESFAGGGALPTLPLTTWIVRLAPHDASAEGLAAALRAGEVPLVARVHDETVVLDCRTLLGEDPEEVAQLVREALHAAEADARGQHGVD